MEVWQEVLGFCPFEEYARMTTSKPASRELYFLLKQSLLELHFGSMLPSPALGGLWMASRDVLATDPRVLNLGLRFLFFLSMLALVRSCLSSCLVCSIFFVWLFFTGSASMSSSLAVEQLAKTVPLPLLRRLVVKLFGMGVSLREVHLRIAPFVRAPRRLQVACWENAG